MLNKHHGITLVEMLIALAISSLLLVGFTTFYALAVYNNKHSLEVVRLDQELYLAMNVMENDIRRAGYWANAEADIGTGDLTNPFMQTATDLQIGGSNNCLLLSYDKDDDQSLPSLGDSSDERYGFRLNNSAIQYRVSSADFSCGSSNGWQDLTDTNIINVSALTFSESNNDFTLDDGNTLRRRNITITLTANLVSDTNITRTLTRTITVRNSKFIKST